MYQGGDRRIGGVQHGIASPRAVIPAAVRFEVHGAEFPALPGIFNASQKARVLLFFGEVEPVFQQDDSAVHDDVFQTWDNFSEISCTRPQYRHTSAQMQSCGDNFAFRRVTGSRQPGENHRYRQMIGGIGFSRPETNSRPESAALTAGIKSVFMLVFTT